MSDTEDSRHLSRTAYHHGSLAEVLMDLAVAQIGKDGIERLNLRALAREAGVSPTAPYRHFPSRQCLLAGIATRGFRRLTEEMREASNDAGFSRDAFARFGMAYVAFARRDPVSYELMFGGVIDFEQYPDLKAAAESGFQQLLDFLSRSLRGTPDPDHLMLTAGTVWAGVHGIASLLTSKFVRLSGVNDSNAVEAVRALAERTEEALHLAFDHLAPY